MSNRHRPAASSRGGVCVDPVRRSSRVGAVAITFLKKTELSQTAETRKHRTPVQDRSEKKRARILHEARIAFAQEGFEAANVRDIAAAAGTRHSMIRYHFGTKEQLWREAVRDMFEMLDQALALDDSDGEPSGGVERYKDFLRRYIRHCAAHPEHARIMISEAMRGGERLNWIVENFLTPRRDLVERQMATAGNIQQMPKMHPLSLVYIVSSICQMPYVLAKESQSLFDVDVQAPELVDAHIESVINLFFQYRESDASGQ